MNQAHLLMALLLLTTSVALGDSKEEIAIIKKPAVGLMEDSSEANRMNKSYLLTAQLLGSAVSPVPSAGLNAGVYLDRNTLIEAQFSHGKTASYLFFDIEATTFGLSYKHFFSNSFYARLGGAYRKILLKDAWLWFSDRTLSEVGSVESLAVDLAIGNQWQWENFTLGCDWFGYMAPVATLSKKYDPNGATGQDLKDLDDSWNRLANVGSFQLLRFYLGASF